MPRRVSVYVLLLSLASPIAVLAGPFTGSGSGLSGDHGFHIPSAAVDGWDRFSTRSTYQEWDVFYQPGGTNYVDADRTDMDPAAGGAAWQVSNPNLYPGIPATFSGYSINSTNGGTAVGGKPTSGATATPGTQAGTSRLTQTNPSAGAFITGAGLPGAGNIYSFSSATSFDVDIWNYDLPNATATTILLQVHVQGSAINAASVKLVNPDGSSPALAPDASQVLFDDPNFSINGNSGVNRTMLYRWTVAGNEEAYKLQFAASGPSMSLQYAAVDTFTSLPEPTGLGLVAMGCGALALRRQRRPL